MSIIKCRKYLPWPAALSGTNDNTTTDYHHHHHHQHNYYHHFGKIKCKMHQSKTFIVVWFGHRQSTVGLKIKALQSNVKSPAIEDFLETVRFLQLTVHKNCALYTLCTLQYKQWTVSSWLGRVGLGSRRAECPRLLNWLPVIRHCLNLIIIIIIVVVIIISTLLYSFFLFYEVKI